MKRSKTNRWTGWRLARVSSVLSLIFAFVISSLPFCVCSCAASGCEVEPNADASSGCCSTECCTTIISCCSDSVACCSSDSDATSAVNDRDDNSDVEVCVCVSKGCHCELRMVVPIIGDVNQQVENQSNAFLELARLAPIYELKPVVQLANFVPPQRLSSLRLHAMLSIWLN